MERGVGTSVPPEHGVEENDVRVGDLVEEVVCMGHARRRAEGAEVDEVGDGGSVVLEVAFYGGGLYLFELCECGAFG